MKYYLLPETGNFYKANLHSHSTVSDGTLTPAEMKELYKSRGYSVLACTDHEIMVPHHDLTDNDFLMLTGFELGFDENWRPDFLDARVCDLCIISLDRENNVQPCFHRTKYHNPQRNTEIMFDENEPDFEREYNADCINAAIKKCREKGFFVTYNHPTWSLEHYEDYIKYKGMNAMEICNYSSFIDGYDEYNSKAYDDFLRKGERIFCIGADDNHNRRDPSCRMWDSFGAFTVIKAEDLTYESIADALKNGNFYSSQGPEIYALYFEDDKLHVECSPADKVVCTVNKRRCMSRYNEETGVINHAVFEIKPSDGYFRVTVIDKNGLKADTNAYFTDTLNISVTE
ncbi:MAG: PHP domain-containing protein [Ruminococcaceae bacterium]|nr:PHP domain-containing protein [Oscillospiraceae bacterium]MBR3598004.1 PHP domain-containing protein [Clostridia bacterium]